MLGNPMLDVAIGLIFLYVLLSIIITALQEFISSFLKLRNKTLLNAIGELLGDKNKKEFFEHPLIFPLFKGKVGEDGNPEEGGPAYIPARNFAFAVFAMQRNRNAVTDKPPPAFALAQYFAEAASHGTLADRIKQFDTTATGLIDNISNSTVKKAATDALTTAVGELKTATDVVETAIKEIELLYDNTMNRVAGWYKVKVQWMTFVLSISVAVLLNADTVYIGQRLWQDEALRSQAVAAAEAFYKSNTGQKQLEELCKAEIEDDAKAKAGSDGNKLSFDQWQKIKDCTQTELKEAMDQLTTTGYPLGWSFHDDQNWPLHDDQNYILALIGWILTGLALSLGSSFWFDLLSKFMNVRQTGKREEGTTPPPSSTSKGSGKTK